MSGCDTCSLCCKALEIVDLPAPSPHGKWCSHAKPGRIPGACTIYQDRPESCRAFECVWLISQSRPGDVMPPGLRPDRCHAVLTAVPGENTLVVHPDPGYADAWKKGLLNSLLHTFMENGGKVILMRDGVSKPLTLKEAT